MRNVSRLNINNTFKSLNYNAYLEHDNHVLHSGNTEELHKIEQLLTNKNAVGYIFIMDSNISVKMIKDSLGCGAYVKYLVNNLPASTLFDIGNNRNFEILYRYHENFTQEELINYDRARQVFRVGLYVSSKYTQDVVKFLFNINDTRFIIERAYIDFTINNTSEYDITYKINFFKQVHEVLARWHIQCHLGCNSKNSLDELTTTVDKLNKEGEFNG